MRNPRAATSRRGAVLAALAVLVSACSQGSGTFAVSHPPAGPKTILVAMGGNESPGFSVSGPAQDWAQLFYGEALSRRSTLYDLSSSTGPYVEDLLNGETAQAIGLHPDLVAVWVGMPDLLVGMTPTTFEQDLEQVLGQLDRARGEVLVANLLPIYRFSSYARCEAQPTACGLTVGTLPPVEELTNAVSGYDRAISAAAAQTRAVVVDLNGVFSERLGSAHPPASGALVDQSDLGLTEAGEQLVADAFANAYAGSLKKGHA